MKHNSVVLVVDFANKNLLAREEFTNSNTKKEKQKLEKIQEIILKLTLGKTQALTPICEYNKVKEKKVS